VLSPVYRVGILTPKVGMKSRTFIPTIVTVLRCSRLQANAPAWFVPCGRSYTLNSLELPERLREPTRVVHVERKGTRSWTLRHARAWRNCINTSGNMAANRATRNWRQRVSGGRKRRSTESKHVEGKQPGRVWCVPSICRKILILHLPLPNRNGCPFLEFLHALREIPHALWVYRHSRWTPVAARARRGLGCTGKNIPTAVPSFVPTTKLYRLLPSRRSQVRVLHCPPHDGYLWGVILAQFCLPAQENRVQPKSSGCRDWFLRSSKSPPPTQNARWAKWRRHRKSAEH